MEVDKQSQMDKLPDDIMLSSAEDLNNDGSFMASAPEDRRTPERDLDDAVEELMHSEEPEDAQIDPEETPEERRERRMADRGLRREMPIFHREEMTRLTAERPRLDGARPRMDDVRRVEAEEKPVVMMPDDSEAEPRAERRHEDEPRETVCRRECGPRHEAKIVTAEPYRGVNKMALIWMIVLTVVLGGVIGIMLYAFILDRIDAANPEPAVDSSIQENMQAIAGALEVYLTNVNLDNYNTDIVLVNGGGTVTLTGTLKHTVYVNATSAETVVLNGVTIESAESAAMVNLSKNALTLRADGLNTMRADGGKYGAALYSAGALTIRGDGQLMIYSGGTGSRGIASTGGYEVHGGSVVALGQTSIERPVDDSTQAYFAKELPQVYREGTVVSASNEDGSEVVRFTAPGDFSSIFVSNSKLKDGVQYSISLGSGGAK